MMDVASTIICALCGFHTEENFYDILASHHDSIRAIYSVAQVLRPLLKSHLIQ